MSIVYPDVDSLIQLQLITTWLNSILVLLKLSYEYNYESLESPVVVKMNVICISTEDEDGETGKERTELER